MPESRYRRFVRFGVAARRCSSTVRRMGLLPQLLDRLSDRALDRIDMAVSFVMKSGLARILGPLEDALDRGAHVRILTTDYLAITDLDALAQLADLASDPDRRLEVRLGRRGAGRRLAARIGVAVLLSQCGAGRGRPGSHRPRCGNCATDRRRLCGPGGGRAARRPVAP